MKRITGNMTRRDGGMSDHPKKDGGVQKRDTDVSPGIDLFGGAESVGSGGCASGCGAGARTGEAQGTPAALGDAADVLDRGVFADLGEEVGRLTDEKQAAYGDSFNRAAGVLMLFFPDGVQVKDYRRLMLFTRVIDKMFRDVTQPDAYGEDPWRDIAGYALLAVRGHR